MTETRTVVGSSTNNIERMRAAAKEFVWLWDRYGDQLGTTIRLGGWVAARQTGASRLGVEPTDAVSVAAVESLVARMREWAAEDD